MINDDNIGRPPLVEAIYVCRDCGTEEECPPSLAPAIADAVMIRRGWSLGPAGRGINLDRCPACNAA